MIGLRSALRWVHAKFDAAMQRNRSGGSASAQLGVCVLLFGSAAKAEMLNLAGQQLQTGPASVVAYRQPDDPPADWAAAFARAAATGRPIYVPTGTYPVCDAITLPNGVELFGDGRTQSILLAGPCFNKDALAVVRLGTSEPGATIRDLGVTFVQPSEANTRAAIIRYPPAIYAQGAPRCRVRDVRITAAWDGVDARGNAGGCVFDTVEVGAFGHGLRLDGALDFIGIRGWHAWPFGMSSGGLYRVYADGEAIAAELGRVDGLSVDGFSTFRARFVTLDRGEHSAFGTISNLALDGDGATLEFNGGAIGISSVYSTKTAVPTVPAISVDGAHSSLTITNLEMRLSHSAPALLVRNGQLRVVGGRILQDSVDGLALRVTGGMAAINGVSFANNVPATRTAPLVHQSAGTLAMVGTTWNAGQGARGVTIGADTEGNLLSANAFNGWRATVPAHAARGTYGPNR